MKYMIFILILAFAIFGQNIQLIGGVGGDSDFADSARVASYADSARVSVYADSSRVSGSGGLDSVLTDKYWSNYTSSGRLWGGVITTNVDGTINIARGGGLAKMQSGGSGVLDSIPASINDAQGSMVQYVEWDSLINFELIDSAYNLVYYDYSGDSITTSTRENFYSEFDFVTDFTIGRVYKSGTNVVARLCGMNTWNFARRVQMFGEERFPVERASGLVIGASGLQYSVTDGVVWAELVNRFDVGGKALADTFYFWYYTTGVGWSVDTTTSIQVTQYNDTTTGLVNFGGATNLWRSDYVYVVHDGTHHVVCGQSEENTQLKAEQVPIPTPPMLLEAYATLVGRIDVLKNTSNIIVASAYGNVFSAVAIPDHNSLSGLQLAANTVTYGHISDSTQTIAGLKTFSDNIAVDTIFFSGGDTLFEISDSVTYAIYADTAQYAVNSDSSVYADTASHALYADTTEYSINSLTSITSDSSVYSVYADTASYSENSDSSIYADTASYATTIDTTDTDFTTYVANNSGGGSSRWTTFSGTRVNDSTMYVTGGQATIGERTPIRYRETSGTWRYGFVLWTNDSTADIYGAPMTTSDDDEFQYGTYDMVRYIPIAINGYWADGVSTKLLEEDLLMKFGIIPPYGEAYLVNVKTVVLTDDSGASQPRLNVSNGGNAILTNNTNAGIEPLETAVFTRIGFNVTNYKITTENVELTTDANGTNNDSQNLSVHLMLIVP